MLIRNYQSTDQTAWLRCRALAFLDTCYYDDVWPRRPEGPPIQLVAIKNGVLAGLLDVEIDGDLATIDTVAVHPDHRGLGVATALLEAAIGLVPAGVTTLDAWTREDAPALAWYRRRGFAESDHYLHVYKGYDEPNDGWASPAPLWRPVMAFCHAPLDAEAAVRARFARVYVCRRFSRPVR